MLKNIVNFFGIAASVSIFVMAWLLIVSGSVHPYIIFVPILLFILYFLLFMVKIVVDFYKLDRDKRSKIIQESDTQEEERKKKTDSFHSIAFYIAPRR